MPTLRRAILASAVVLATGGCGSDFTTTPSPASGEPVAAPTTIAVRPAFDSAPCPDDVSREVVYAISCGYLTTLQDRSKPSGRTVRLLVERIDPPGGTTTPDPMVMVGDGNFGSRPDYGGLGGRMHRVEYVIDRRGTAHSEPNLDCPEVVAVSPTLVGLRFGDPAHAASLRDAVGACHDRLTSQGIDLAAFDLAAGAADVEDLRVALGIERWNAIAYGTSSRQAFEVARDFPAGLRSVIVDSPTLPAPDLLTAGPATLDLAIARLVAACQGGAACARLAPDLGSGIGEAIARLDETPFVTELDGTPSALLLGHPIRVVVDGAGLLRWIRATLAEDGGQGQATIVSTVLRVLDGKLTPDDRVVTSLAEDIGDCLGILPRCNRTSLGALYSIVCRDLLPAADAARLERDIAGRRAYAELFSPGPFGAACAAWSVAPAAAPGTGHPTGEVPTLVLRGAADPFSAPLTDLAAATGGVPGVYTLAIPNMAYNVLSNGCVRTIRDAWLDAPTGPPADTSCLARIPSVSLGD